MISPARCFSVSAPAAGAVANDESTGGADAGFTTAGDAPGIDATCKRDTVSRTGTVGAMARGALDAPCLLATALTGFPAGAEIARVSGVAVDTNGAEAGRLLLTTIDSARSATDGAAAAAGGIDRNTRNPTAASATTPPPMSSPRRLPPTLTGMGGCSNAAAGARRKGSFGVAATGEESGVISRVMMSVLARGTAAAATTSSAKSLTFEYRSSGSGLRARSSAFCRRGDHVTCGRTSASARGRSVSRCTSDCLDVTVGCGSSPVSIVNVTNPSE